MMNEPNISMAYIQDFLPSDDFFINSLVIKDLLLMDKVDMAILFLARSQLRLVDKEKLMSVILSHDSQTKHKMKETANHRAPIYLYCPHCSNCMFFLNGKLLCLKCKK
ncbi:MAG: hypothetical protein ACTSPG_03835 [Candidatus Hodarchaeales archaeon]